MANVNLQLNITASNQAQPGLAGVIAGIQQVAQQAQQAGAQTTTAFASIRGQINSLAANVTAASTAFLAFQSGASAAVGVLGEVTRPISEAINKWSKSSTEIKQLERAWESAGRSIPVKEVLDFNKQLAQTAGVSPGEMRGVVKFFAQIPQVADENMQKVLAITTNIAAYSGQSVESVARRVSMAIQGNTYGLRRLGVSISDTAKHSGDVSVIINELDRKTSGMAKEFGGSWAGQAKQIEMAWQRIWPAVGEVIGTALVPVLEKIRERTVALADSVVNFVKTADFSALKSVITELGMGFLTVRDAVVAAGTEIGKSILQVIAGTAITDNNFADVLVTKIRGLAEWIAKLIGWIGSVTSSLVGNHWVQWAVILGVGARIAIGVFNLVVGTATRLLGVIAGIGETGVAAMASIRSGIMSANQGLMQQNAQLNALMVTWGRLRAVGSAPVAATGAAMVPGQGVMVAPGATGGATRASRAAGVAGAAGAGLMVAGIGASMAGSEYGDTAATVGGMAMAGSVLAAHWSSIAAAAASVKATIAGIVASTVAIAAGIGLVIGGALAAITVWAGGWRKDAKEIEAGIAKDAMALEARGKARGADLKNFRELSTSDVGGQTDIDKVSAAYQEQADYVDQLTAKRMEALSRGDEAEAKSWATKISVARQNAQLLREQRMKLIEDKAAAVQADADMMGAITASLSTMGMAFSAAFEEAAAKAEGFDAKLKAVRETAAYLNKEVSAFYDATRSMDEVSAGSQRTSIVAGAPSSEAAAPALAQLDRDNAARRVELALAEQAEKKRIRETDYAAEKAILEDHLSKVKAGSAEHTKILQQTSELEKRYRDETMTGEKAMRDAVVNEIKKQQSEVQKLYDARRDLVDKLANADQDAARALRDVATKSMTEWGRLQNSFNEASLSFQRAVELMPSSPQKAIEMATKARGEFAALLQDINALKTNVQDTDKFYKDLVREFNKKGMSPVAAWQSDVDKVFETLREARGQMGAGEYKEAQKLYREAAQLAKVLENAPDAVGKQQGRAVTADFLNLIQKEGRTAAEAELVRAKEIEQNTRANIEILNDTIKNGMLTQLQSNTNQLAAVDNSLKQLITQLGGTPQAPQGATPLEAAKRSETDAGAEFLQSTDKKAKAALQQQWGAASAQRAQAEASVARGREWAPQYDARGQLRPPSEDRLAYMAELKASDQKNYLREMAALAEARIQEQKNMYEGGQISNKARDSNIYALKQVRGRYLEEVGAITDEEDRALLAKRVEREREEGHFSPLTEALAGKQTVSVVGGEIISKVGAVRDGARDMTQTVSQGLAQRMADAATVAEGLLKPMRPAYAGAGGSGAQDGSTSGLGAIDLGAKQMVSAAEDVRKALMESLPKQIRVDIEVKGGDAKIDRI